MSADFKPLGPGPIMRAQSSPWRTGVEILMASQSPSGKRVVVKDVVFEEVDENACYEIPRLTLANAQAQVLMDDLWHSGLRPTEGSGSAGSLKATERHLEDMRKIAFDLLGKETAK